MSWLELLCRHAGPVHDDDSRSCFHPQISGLKIVAPAQCGRCDYRDRPVEGLLSGIASPQRERECACLIDARSPEQNGESPVSIGTDDAWWTQPLGCSDPAHVRTTRRQCADCPDYLFPVLTPRTPVEAVRRLLDAPGTLRPAGWWSFPNVQESYRRRAADAIGRIEPYPARFDGRGIVLLGGGKYFASAYVTIRVLRHVGCELPIELWHLAGEMSDGERALVVPYGVACIDGESHARRNAFPLHDSWWKGWQLKPYAILHSAFREVLYLDADCYPTRNPESLFDDLGYRERGAVFWPDIPLSSCLFPENAPEIFGIPPMEGAPAESGQLLIHKEWCWRELNLALYYNSIPDFTYRTLWGDKDTFPIAWRRLGREYARLWPTADRTPQAILQLDREGRPIFQHRASDKFRLPGTQFDSNRQALPKNDYNPALAHEDFCFGVLAELSQAIAARGAVDELDAERVAALLPPGKSVIPAWQSRAEVEADCHRHAASAPLNDDLSVCRVLGGPILVVDSVEPHLAAHLLREGLWEAWITAFLAPRIGPGMHCVDIGANFGYFTALFAERAGPGGRVLAVEPQPLVAQYLRLSVAANGWSHVIVEESMIGSRRGVETLWCGNRSCYNASFRKDMSAAGSLSVERKCVPLGDLVEGWPRLDIVKIDAEGAEPHIWSGAADLFHQRRPSIVLEYCGARYDAPREFLDAIRDVYPRLQWIDYWGVSRDISTVELLETPQTERMLFLSDD